MNSSMNSWLASYEASRVDGIASAKARLSNRKFPDLESMSWAEIRGLPVYGLDEGLTYGRAFEALRKSWYSYKRSRKDGFPATDVAFRILKIEKALGLEPLSEFPELDSDWVEAELKSVEDIELAREEYIDRSDGFDMEQMSPEERMEYEELKKEERQAEMEALGVEEPEQRQGQDWF